MMEKRRRLLVTALAALATLGLAAQASAHVYWTNPSPFASAIGRSALDGSAVNSSFITGANAATGVAVDGRHVYWANATGGTIGRSNLDGSGVNQSFITGGDSSSGVEVDGLDV